MEEKIAREEFPIWSNAPIKIYDPDHRTTEPLPFRMRLELWSRKIWKKHRMTAFMAVGLAAWTLLTCSLTEVVVRRTTTEEVTARVTSELRAGFVQYQAQQDYERSASAFLAGEDSLQAAIDAESEALAKLLYGYRNNSLRDRKTLLWCVLARVDNAAYPGSVAGVVDQKQQWMFYSTDNPIRSDDKTIAMEQLKEWHAGRYPAGFSSEYVYAEWSSTDIALRNTWEKDSSTSWWRFPE